MKEIALMFAEDIVHNFIINEGDSGSYCIGCNSFSEYGERIQHTNSCVYLKAKQFVQDNGD